ncbi:hypothetical protein D7U98_05625 [Stenotrophomonas maltophilia]|uniref:hypothetical protein n=1 Tax=Stenotrophomonas maltophilia TaxID=40324 RepID=UPI0015DE249A|nr:hypothetical protein [Stenotrophomonas maltophilia]MBA0394883.1 hypothetical protein [Stenotrophomonas maltophilia]
MNEAAVGTNALAVARELEAAFLQGVKIPSCANCNGKARVCWSGRESQLVQFHCRHCGPRNAVFDSIAPLQCGRCGTAPAGLFPRAAQIQCCSCGACSAVFVGPDPAGALAAALDAWCRRAPILPSMPDDAAALRRGAAPDGFDDDGKGDVLEMLSRLLVGGSYRMPVEGRSTLPPLGSSDIAGAVGYMRNPLEKHTALAVATRMGPAAIARLSLAAYRLVAKDVRALRPRPLDLGKPADRWRLRLVIYDAAHELVWPERRQPFAGLAKSAKMRKGNYIKAHKCATAVLQEALHGGRRGFRQAMWAGESCSSAAE